jgi:hypothetical protein
MPFSMENRYCLMQLRTCVVIYQHSLQTSLPQKLPRIYLEVEELCGLCADEDDVPRRAASLKICDKCVQLSFKH